MSTSNTTNPMTPTECNSDHEVRYWNLYQCAKQRDTTHRPVLHEHHYNKQYKYPAARKMMIYMSNRYSKHRIPGVYSAIPTSVVAVGIAVAVLFMMMTWNWIGILQQQHDMYTGRQGQHQTKGTERNAFIQSNTIYDEMDRTTNLPYFRDGSSSNDIYYQSQAEMMNRSQRFPSIVERVKFYMSNWYRPPCHNNNESTVNDVGFIHYRYDTNQNNFKHVLVREVQSTANTETQGNLRRRTFMIYPNTTLGKIHYLVPNQIRPENCHSEYCTDILHYWLPAMERTGYSIFEKSNEEIPPVLFQFSDEEISRSFAITTNDIAVYPNVPHLKKSRYALHDDQEIIRLSENECSLVPKSILRTTTASSIEHIPHLHPIIYKLKTNRHYGMMDKIPLQDISWSQKKNQAIFRGTLTGLLPPTSRFKLSTRNSHASVLTNNDAEEKCLELDRCRLVYQINRHYNKDSNDGFQKSSRGTIDNNSSVLVDAKLVLPQLQHTDMPMQIHNVPIYGNRMTKQDLMSYKVIIMLEGNDAGTGLKWALFSNSVVMTNAVPQFSSWLMEEWLQPWVHYIPLDLSTEENLAYDIHDKMEWVLNHDVEAQNIARRGALWVRDLLFHPNAISDDEAITDEMVRRYMMHFVLDDTI